MLGAGAFESEFRDGAWTYLLSRPVRKGTIWSAKLVALLSILAGFWLAFIGLMAVVPGLGEVVSGFKLPEMLGSGLEFLPLILLSSLFFFSIAFSLSILTDKQLSLVFGTLFLGLVLEGALLFLALLAAGGEMETRTGQFLVLGVFNLGLVLSSLAFLAASRLTLLKADFSQPRKKAKALAMWGFLFLTAAWAFSAAWPALRPGPAEELSSRIEVIEGGAFFSTTKGLYRYDIAGDKVNRLVHWNPFDGRYAMGGGKVLYTVFRPKDEKFDLYVQNTDGSGQRLLAGGSQEDQHILSGLMFPKVSPDGKTAVLLYEEIFETSALPHHVWSLASIGTDGTGLRKLAPLDPGLVGDGKTRTSVAIVAWLHTPESLLMWGRPRTTPPWITMPPHSLWRYDLASGAQTRLFESPGSVSLVPNPAANTAILISEKDEAGPIDVSLLDLATGTTTPITTIERPGKEYLWSAIQHSAWSGDGDRVGFLIHREGDLWAPAVYAGKEHRFVTGPDIRLEGSQDRYPSVLAWTGDGTKLVVAVGQERSLHFLGPNLALAKEVPVPPAVGGNFTARPVGNAVLVSDYANVAVWRLDLKTEKWKKIF